MEKEFVKIFSDGGARGNPGPAGIGAVIYNSQNKKVAEVSEYLGITTNNQAEYKALIEALRKAKEMNFEYIKCYLDSELVVRQLNGEYKVKNKDLAPLFLQVHNLKCQFKEISYHHIRREENKEADKLANIAMDRAKI